MMHCESAGRWPHHPPLCPGRQRQMPWQTGLVLALLAITVWRVWVVVHVHAGLYVDEAQYWVWSRALDWGYYSKPPMIAALIALSTQLFGDGVLGVKALAMLCYPLAAWVVYRWVGEVVADSAAALPAEARSAMKPVRAGLVAALVFIASPVAGLLGLAATTDAPLLLAWALASRALWRAGRHGRPADWLALGGWLGLGLMSKYTMAAFAVSALGWLWTLPRRAPAAEAWSLHRGLLATAVVATLCVAPNLAWNAVHGWPTWHHTAEITLGAAPEPWRTTMGEYLAGLAMLLGPVVVPWALAWAWRAGRFSPMPSLCGAAGAASGSRHEAWRLAAWLVGPLVAIGALQAWHAKAQVNWVAPALVGAALALALWLRAEWPGRPLRGWYLALAAQVVLLAGVTLAGDLAEAVDRPLPRHLDVWARMRGWDEAFEQLRPAAEAYWRSRGSQPRQVLGGDRAVLANGAYAWRHLSPQWVAWREAGQAPHDHFQLLSPLQPGDRRQPLLIVSEGPPDAAWQTALGGPPRRLAVAEVEQSPGRRLHLELWQAEVAPAPTLAKARGPGSPAVVAQGAVP